MATLHDLINNAIGVLPLPPLNDLVRGLAFLLSIGSLSYMAIEGIPPPEYYIVVTATMAGYFFGHQQGRKEFATRKEDNQ